jgi:hypothetical protein
VGRVDFVDRRRHRDEVGVGHGPPLWPPRTRPLDEGDRSALEITTPSSASSSTASRAPWSEGEWGSLIMGRISQVVLCGRLGEPIREPIDTNSPELARLYQESDSRSTSGFMYVRELTRMPRCSFTPKCSQGISVPSGAPGIVLRRLTSNRVGGGVAPPPLTPPDMRARIRRFVKPFGRDAARSC